MLKAFPGTSANIAKAVRAIYPTPKGVDNLRKVETVSLGGILAPDSVRLNTQPHLGGRHIVRKA